MHGRFSIDKASHSPTFPFGEAFPSSDSHYMYFYQHNETLPSVIDPLASPHPLHSEKECVVIIGEKHFFQFLGIHLICLRKNVSGQFPARSVEVSNTLLDTKFRQSSHLVSKLST